MCDLLKIEYHAKDRLPADAVAVVEATDDRIVVYLSEAYPMAVVAAHLGPMLTAYCAVNEVKQHLAAVDRDVPLKRVTMPRRLAAVAVLPLTGCAWIAATFSQVAPALGA